MNWKYSESFAGIGAWGKAIKQVTKNHGDTCELKWYAEIDKYASNAFSAIHDVSEDLNIWDITKDTKVDEVDIFFYSPPCQTFSIAGRRELTTVPKGNLFYNALDKIKQIKPKYLIMENVKGLLSGAAYEDFKYMFIELERNGYFNYAKVLNTKDYGIPQNRERVFIVSIRKDLYDQGKRFEFPKGMKLEKRLFDMLEDEADEKYFLSQKMINAFLLNEDWASRFQLKKETDIANCIDTKEGGRRTNNFFGYYYLKPNHNIGIYNELVVRKLKPLECFRLQGFEDEDYYKAVTAYDKKFGLNKDGTTKSNAQMYMRAGNSITVNVIVEILENLLYDRKQEGQQLSLF